ncbi:MAG: type I polyketide synthase, partial [Phycicoccus sp.]
MTGQPPVAVTAVSCRFPGAADPEQFWQLLTEGRQGLKRFTDAELSARAVPRRLRQDPGYVPVGAVIDGQDLFDPVPFGLTDAEAAVMDPQQRLFLQCCWRGLERAGHGGGRDSGAVGVFAGAAHSAYLTSNLAGRWDPTGGGADPVASLETAIGTHTDYLPLQVAYRLNLTGPAIAVNTTCSTSLVAVHLAVQSLLAGECDLALAGGASLIVPQGRGYRHVPDGIFSTDGTVRPFSAEGTGIVYSQGVGVVVLRRLEDALADGDPVLAVVHGTAVNNDGADKAGLTAPSPRGQARVIAEALAVAGVTAPQVGYVEAHGTATPLGDSVEVAALSRVFGDHGPPWCGLGSVKSNLGHTNSAAGIASLIKTVLARHHAVLPASLHSTPLNEQLGLADSPFEVVTDARPWPPPRYAGVSSFGIGGTNCHVVLGPAPDRAPSPPDTRPQLLLASGHTAAAAEEMATALVDLPDGESLADLAFTLQEGRTHAPYRVAVLAPAPDERPPAQPVRPGLRPPRLVFGFPGGGSQFPGMGAGLYAAEPVFTETVDECARLLAPLIGADVRDAIASSRPIDSSRLDDASFGLPALFAVSLATARLLQSWNVRPDVVLGHSLGEYAAAVVAGVLSLPDATRLVATRCTEMARFAGAGAMVAVPLPESDVLRLLERHADIDLAAVNGPEACVLAGPVEAVTVVESELVRDGVAPTRLRLTAGPHSRLMEPAMPAVGAVAADVLPGPPTVAYASTVSGGVLADELSDPGYWVRQLREPVRYSDALRAAVETGQGPTVVLQVGPGSALLALARQHRLEALTATLATIPLTDRDPDVQSLRETVGSLWMHGVEVDFAAMHHPGRRRVLAPGYAFEPRRLWVEPPAPASEHPSGPAPDLEEPLHVPVWRQSAPVDAVSPVGGAWLVVGGDQELAGAVLDAFAEAGHTAALVDLRREASRAAVPGPDDGTPAGVVVLAESSGPGRVTTQVMRHGDVARLLGECRPDVLLQVTRGGAAVAPTDRVDVAAAAARTLPRVLAQEHRGLRWRTVDVDRAAPVGPTARRVVAEAIALAGDPGSGGEVAIRAGSRWCRELTPWRPQAPDLAEPRHPGHQGTALVIGGLGDVGLAVARHLDATGYRVVVTSRRGLDAVTPAQAEALAAAPALEVRQVDATDREGTAALVEELSTGDAAMRLVVHAAGAAGDDGFAALREVEEEAVARQVGPKLEGALALRAAIDGLPRERRPGVVVLMSSVAAVLGGVGAGPYAAANAAMDAVAQDAGDEATRWVSIQWDGWSVGPAGAQRVVALREALDAASGLAALDRVLDSAARP